MITIVSYYKCTRKFFHTGNCTLCVKKSAEQVSTSHTWEKSPWSSG